MATVTVQLRDGLRVGEETHREAELREATVADLIDATAESERLVQTPQGEFQLVPSATMLGLHVLRRQIVRVGSHQGPFTVGELRKLSMFDLNALQALASQLEAASLGGARAGEPGSEDEGGTS